MNVCAPLRSRSASQSSSRPRSPGSRSSASRHSTTSSVRPQRTATATQPGKDFTTWDLPRLFAEIDKQFQKAIAAEKILKATPIGAWNDLLAKGTMPDSYRPTLYDFIAHQALGCRGYSRTDMMIREQEIYVLETNTIPGMTATSLFPQGAKAAGIDFPDLLDTLITLALEKE